MFSKMKSAAFLLASAAAAFAGRTAAADGLDSTKVLAPFVNGETFIAAYVNLGAMNVTQVSGELLKYLPADPTIAGPWMAGSAMADGVVRQFQQAGGASVYLVAGLPDVRQDGGPVAIVTAQSGQSIDKVETLAKNLLRQFNATDVVTGRKGDVFIVGSKSNVERYSKLQPADRGDLIDPLAKLIGERTFAAVVFCPGADYRRVVRELWPQLPGALAAMKGELADRWLRVELSLNQPPDIKPRLALVASDVASAELFAKLWRDIPTATTQFGGNQASKDLAKGYAQLLVDSVPAKVSGNTVELGIPTDETQLAQLKTMFTTAADKAMENSRRVQRLNSFKQLALAMFLYESQHHHLPAVAAIRGKDGKPLLSWRVALLPFLDQSDLYRQFNFDEPWDSPANKALISNMPAIFVDPDPKLAQLAREGKTTYLVPAGKETLFHNDAGATFKEVTDGTAQTIMIIGVDPSRAVEWTKPDDWNVDLVNPYDGLGADSRTNTVAAFADGHVEVLPLKKGDAGAQRLRAELTRAAKDVVNP